MLIFSAEAKKRMRERLMLYHESIVVADVAKNRKNTTFSTVYKEFTVYWNYGRYVIWEDWTVITIMLKAKEDDPELVDKNKRKQKFVRVIWNQELTEQFYKVIFE